MKIIIKAINKLGHKVTIKGTYQEDSNKNKKVNLLQNNTSILYRDNFLTTIIK